MNKEIQDELNEIAPTLAKLPRVNAFSVPVMYFSTLPEKIIEATLKEELTLAEPELSPLLLSLKKSKAMQLPEGYFANTSSAFIERIRHEEVKEELAIVAPSLLNVAKENPFTVPSNYFASLSQKVLQKAKTEEAAATLSLGWLDGVNNVLDKLLTPLFNPRLSFAFAVVFVGVMIFWFGVQQRNIKLDTNSELAAQLQSINHDEVHNYVAMNIDDFDETTLIRKINTDKSLMVIDDALLNDANFEQELLKELDEENFYNNLEPV